MTQADLFDPPPEPAPARRRPAYQQTSREAYQGFGGAVSGALDSLIVEALNRAGPEGLTCEAIELAIGRTHQAVSGNLRHIVERGIIRDSGAKGKTSSGRSAILWVLA